MMTPSTPDEVTREALVMAWKNSPDALAPDKPPPSSMAMWPYRFNRALRRFDGETAAVLIQQAEKESVEIVIGSGYLLGKGRILIAISFVILVYGIVSGKIVLFVPGILFWYFGVTPARKANIARIQAKYDQKFIADVRRYAEQVQAKRI